jgi:3-deoxy-7-phosphoheptulonate synthase
MIIVMEADAPPEAIESVVRQLEASGQAVHRLIGSSRTLLAILGTPLEHGYELWKDLPYVADVVRIEEPFRLASRRFRNASTIVSGAWGNIGGDKPWLAVEPIGLDRVADMPYDIAAGRPFDAAVMRGAVVPKHVGALACLPLDPSPGNGTEVAFVHRVPSWGANKWIGLAERELANGRGAVVLLEAGGEYPKGARTLEIAAIARAKIRTHLPIVVDAPTVAQRARYVAAVAQAAIAGGADGVILRAWVGKEGEPASVAATLPWSQAVELGVRLRAIAAAARG